MAHNGRADHAVQAIFWDRELAVFLQEARDKDDNTTTAAPATMEATQGGSETKKRKVERPTWSCSNCSRRKIKCDKLLPCSQCVKRGKSESCRSELDEPLDDGEHTASGLNLLVADPNLATPSELHALRQTVLTLRQRLHFIEVFCSKIGQPAGSLGGEADGELADSFPQGDEAKPFRKPSIPYPSPTTATSSQLLFPQPSYDHVQGHAPAPTSPPIPSRPVAPRPSQPRPDDNGDTTTGTEDPDVHATVLLEFSAMGQQQGPTVNHSGVRRKAEPAASPASVATSAAPLPPMSVSSRDGESLLPRSFEARRRSILFPSRTIAQTVIKHSLDFCGWQHGSVVKGRFLAECNEFYDIGEARWSIANPQWLAMFYAVMLVGARHEVKAVTEGLFQVGPNEGVKIAELYFDASLNALHRGEFIIHPSLNSVQAIVILLASCYDVGPAPVMTTLLASGISVAKHLGLHMLGDDADWKRQQEAAGIKPLTELGIMNLVDRELSKRLWWALTIEDWTLIPLQHTYTVNPASMTTPIPANVHDDDLCEGRLIVRSLNEPTVATKIILWSRLAVIVRRFFDDLRAGPADPYAVCLKRDAEIRRVIEEAPDYLRHNYVARSDSPAYLLWMRSNFSTSTNHKLLAIHRPFLGQRYTGQSKYAYSRRVALEAAISIIDTFANYPTPPTPFSFTLPLHATAAASVLLLDLFQSPRNYQSAELNARREKVKRALERLSVFHDADSPVSSRAVALLSALLAEEQKRHGQGGFDFNPHTFAEVSKRVSASCSPATSMGSPAASPQRHSSNQQQDQRSPQSGHYGRAAFAPGVDNMLSLASSPAAPGYAGVPDFMPYDYQMQVPAYSHPYDEPFDQQALQLNLDFTSMDFWSSSFTQPGGIQ